jgi:hypothetical protein
MVSSQNQYIIASETLEGQTSDFDDVGGALFRAHGFKPVDSAANRVLDLAPTKIAHGSTGSWRGIGGLTVNEPASWGEFYIHAAGVDTGAYRQPDCRFTSPVAWINLPPAVRGGKSQVVLLPDTLLSRIKDMGLPDVPAKLGEYVGKTALVHAFPARGTMMTGVRDEMLVLASLQVGEIKLGNLDPKNMREVELVGVGYGRKL